MKKYLLFLILVLVLGTQESNGQKIYGGSFSRVIATGLLKDKAFSYGFQCNFYTDKVATGTLPTQLKFKIIRKKDNVMVQEFLANKIVEKDSVTVKNDCIVPNSTPKTTFYTVQYYHERIILPTEYDSPEGYYVINEPVGPRNPTFNVASPNMVLYHWFSPKYLFEQPNDGDDGKLVSGWGSGTFSYHCKTSGYYNFRVSMTPSQTVVNGATFNLIVKPSVPLTDGSILFRDVDYKSGYSSTNNGTKNLYFPNASPTWQNTKLSEVNLGLSVITYAIFSPQATGNATIAATAQHFRNGEKIAENTNELQVEINDCSFTNYFPTTLSEVGKITNKIDPIICAGKSAQLSLNGGIPIPKTTYQWLKNYEIIPGATNPTLIINQSGLYFVVYNTEGTCKGSSSDYVNAVFTDCQKTGEPSILGNSISSFNGSLSGVPGTQWWNKLSLNSDYYIPVNDFPKMPKTVKSTLFRKKDNLKLDEVILTRNTINDVTLLPKVCGNDKDTVMVISYAGNLTLNATKYPKTDEGYYAITEPVCCRALNDNLNQSKTKVVTYAEFNGANQVAYENLSNKDLLLSVGIPAQIDACTGKDMNIAFNVINKQNISAKLVGLVDVLDESSGSPVFKKIDWKTGFSNLNFGGNAQTFQVIQEGNKFIIKGIPNKVGTYTYRVKFDGMMNGNVYSSVYSEFQIKVRDCGKPLQPTIFVSKVDKPTTQNPTSICQDSTLQLNLRNFSKGSTFTWQRNNIEIPNEKDSILVIKNSQGGNYTCVAYQPQLCPEKMTTTPTKITFYPKPTVTLTASSPTGTLCQGGIVKLSGSSDIANVKYQWFRENVIVNNATNSIFDATESGNYTVKVNSPDGCVNISSPQNVVSNTPPKAEITTSNKVICQGKDITISATTGTGNIYVWTRDGVTLGNNSDSFTTNQTGKYTVKITAPNTCSTVSKPFELMQVDNPTVNIVNPNGNQLCQGSSTTFTIKGNALNGFQWLKDGVKLTAETKNSLSISQEGEYSVSVIDTNGCANTSVVEKITLVNKVIVKFDSIPSLCGVNNPTITLTGTPSGGIFSGNGVNGNEFKSSVSGIGKHKITYTITGSLSCLNGTADREIIVASIPTVTLINPNNSKICVGDKVTISPNIQNGDVFQWFKDNSVIAGANQNTYQTSDAGEYNIEVSNVNNCKAISDNFKVEVFPKTTVLLDSIQSFCGTSFSAIPLNGSPNGGVFIGKGVLGNNFDPKNAGVGTHTITYKIIRDPVCAGGEATRKVIITPPPILNLGLDRDIFKGQSIKLNGDLGNGYTYQWSPPTDLDNPLIPKPNAKPNQSTTYVLKATGPNNCVAVDTITLSVVNVIYVPNIFTPNNDGLNDTWDISGLETYPEVEVSIYNRWGNLVYYSKGNTQKSFDGKFQDQLLAEETYAYVINTNNRGYVLRGTILLQR